jgi:hypothetical protein
VAFLPHQERKPQLWVHASGAMLGPRRGMTISLDPSRVETTFDSLRRNHEKAF